MFGNSNIFQKTLWNNGPVPGEFYNFTGGYQTPSAIGKEFTTPGLFGTQRTSSPITTGTSVIGIKYEQGVMIAADNLVSFGSLARYHDMDRVFKLNEKIIIGTGGDFADFQSLKRSIDQKMSEDNCYADDNCMKPKALYNWITRVMYNRRNRMEPFWLETVVGGMEDDTPFLGHVDMRGRAYEADVVATGFGKHLALPLIREKTENAATLSKDDATQLLKKCMEVLYYRDARSLSKYTLAVSTAEGTSIEGPFSVNENWELAELVKGY